ncbi:MAG: MFS transporter [Actinobacteria bacterium]|nr:MFS transporter [Actinomycetota bacterium]
MPKRFPTLLGFVTLGLFWGAWASVLPDVQHATGVSKGALGFALLFVSLGSIPAMLFIAGPAVDRFGGRAVALACAAFAAATTLPGLATSLPLLVVTLFVAGAASGALDVGINANAGRIETATGKRVMPMAHGLYSVGILCGAVGAGVARNAGAHREAILLTVAALIALTAVLLGADRVPPEPAEHGHTIKIERALLMLGIVCAAALLVEGGIESWSAPFLERQFDARPAVSGLGPGIFGASMAIGRFYGQATKLSERALLVGGGVCGALGCLLTALAPSAPVAIVGLAMGGAGVALYAPIVFGAGARRGAAAVATVTTLGYVGLLIGPALVGGVAQLSSLRGSFIVLALVAATVATAATRVQLD